MSSQTENSQLESLNEDDRKLYEEFLVDNQLFYGPDPEIMSDHTLSPRSELEEKVFATNPDVKKINLVRGRLNSALEESFNMVEQMGVAPGAKWGDLVTAIFTANGDMSQVAPHGIVVFAAVCHYPIKFIRKYWENEPSVGIKDGDGFIHNDSRYGNIHNTDQSMIVPVFYEGELICWLGSTIHEGENGAIEPGGMPSIAESRFDEGLKMCPFKVVENFEIKRDLVNFLQNSVRDPKLQLADIKVKLHSVLRLRDRVLAIVEEFGKEYLIATIRRTLEDTEKEVRKRVAELPNGTTRVNTWIDDDLREHILAKVPINITVKDDQMTLDLRGASPELMNRSTNMSAGSMKTSLLSNLVLFCWPDLPKNQAVLSPVHVLTDENSMVNSSPEAPNAMSLLPIFQCFTLPSTVYAKLAYCMPKRYAAVNANHYNQPATFVYGGLTQHQEVTGNFCADINGNGSGARENSDGEHALSPVFGYMTDTGEMELAEEELPFVRLVSQQIAKDRVGAGKYRSGMGYEQISTVSESDEFGFMSGQSGAKHPSAYGLFGGYGSPTYPLAKIKKINILDTLKTDPQSFKFSMVDLMNEQAYEEGEYSAQSALNFEICNQGEIYMICQGAGGGYGDVLERSTALIMKDIEENLISADYARQLYRIVFDEEKLLVDEEATEKLRQEERQARIKRGIPYDKFVADWVKDEPAEGLPYFGSWDDPSKIIASPPDEERYVMASNNIKGVMMSNPKDRKIKGLEAQIAALEEKVKAGQ
ncbi:acetone carboxylase subunit alpha [Gammaproteobacteria bacterium 50_400_T64]|nr:acetone carboxylase subunit alpha [Gammaproteobacteria bacterium 50_400_T64]